VFDEAAQLRLKTEACRRLAELFDDSAREAVWLQRADHWEQLAIKAAKAQARRALPDKAGAPIKRQA
jgi:hypothetical protein